MSGMQQHRPYPLLFLVCALAWAGATACGGAAPNAVKEARPTTQDRYQAAQTVRAQRQQMEALLQNKLQPVLLDDAKPMDATEGAESDPFSGGNAGQCAQTCGLSEDLCYSTEQICTIAGQYPQERTFQDDCTWAINTCAGARDRCDQCEHAAAGLFD